MVAPNTTKILSIILYPFLGWLCFFKKLFLRASSQAHLVLYPRLFKARKFLLTGGSQWIWSLGPRCNGPKQPLDLACCFCLVNELRVEPGGEVTPEDAEAESFPLVPEVRDDVVFP